MNLTIQDLQNETQMCPSFLASENSCSRHASRFVYVSSHVSLTSRLTSRDKISARDACEEGCSHLVNVSSHKTSRDFSERCTCKRLLTCRLTSPKT
ncbi:hypothetical protein RRG08_066096 [Elysia crispata]|uniref:Uncharacterized protein n=1 Tax=Elysia crispata TaxID=231223 RepID=A0AAE0ZH97_9GAST|nr:hypothetical protein RRG08_066096 [Elysia crispata]